MPTAAYAFRGLSVESEGLNRDGLTRLTVRDYGFLVDLTPYNMPTNFMPLSHSSFAAAMMQATSTDVALTPFTDPYFRGFDNALPDFHHYAEIANSIYANNTLIFWWKTTRRMYTTQLLLVLGASHQRNGFHGRRIVKAIRGA